MNSIEEEDQQLLSAAIARQEQIDIRVARLTDEGLGDWISGTLPLLNAPNKDAEAANELILAYIMLLVATHELDRDTKHLAALQNIRELYEFHASVAPAPDSLDTILNELGTALGPVTGPDGEAL
ncbi:hypothetical protein F1C58_16265 (plasmid) [Glaciihabitans sp. INWT7]|uniref:hypothetical protein n=1 Tax=Glaciihabitans sp. INWT7 TaxID=2596912 RepID=UPI00162AF052|nr:hypothetical protein [Glaciihabitans sp. INWT7]QNE48614.1 hypothetical protein F1C58_16265 [Glaciihabitans sp. INWT7]